MNEIICKGWGGRDRSKSRLSKGFYIIFLIKKKKKEFTARIFTPRRRVLVKCRCIPTCRDSCPVSRLHSSPDAVDTPGAICEGEECRNINRFSWCLCTRYDTVEEKSLLSNLCQSSHVHLSFTHKLTGCRLALHISSLHTKSFNGGNNAAWTLFVSRYYMFVQLGEKSESRFA